MRAYRNAKTNLPTQKEVAASAETRGAIWMVVLAAVSLLVLLVIARST